MAPRKKTTEEKAKEKKKKELSPFDFADAASYSKVDLIRESTQPEHTAKLYAPFMVNRAFALHEDSILHANEMNIRAGIPGQAQFDYYRAVLRKRKRFAKWPKAHKDEDLKLIQRRYSCNVNTAKQIRTVFDNEQMAELRSYYETGGDTTAKKDK